MVHYFLGGVHVQPKEEEEEEYHRPLSHDKKLEPFLERDVHMLLLSKRLLRVQGELAASPNMGNNSKRTNDRYYFHFFLNYRGKNKRTAKVKIDFFSFLFLKNVNGQERARSASNLDPNLVLSVRSEKAVSGACCFV